MILFLINIIINDEKRIQTRDENRELLARTVFLNNYGLNIFQKINNKSLIFLN